MTVTLRAGADAVTVDPRAGGRIVSLIAGGAERLVTEPPEGVADPHHHYGLFVLAPWAGRLQRGKLPFRGRTYHVPTEDGRHALHGVVAAAEWEVLEETPHGVVLTCGLGEWGWPLGGRVWHRLELREGALETELTIVPGPQGMPVAVGWHPWFRRDAGEVRMRVRAVEVLAVDRDNVPTGRRVPVDEQTDLRDCPAVTDRDLDHVYVGVDGVCEVVWPDLALHVHADTSTTVVNTAPHGVCLEPHTGWPNAAVLAAHGVLGTGLTMLEPEDVMRADCLWRWEPR